jgi:DNA-binding protein HU-beta
MTKAELIEAVARSTHQPKNAVASTLDAAFDLIARSIRRDKRFWVPSFGTFTVRRRRARAGYNPRTKSAMTIAAFRTVGFRPAPELRRGL